MTTINTFQAQAFIELALSRGVLKFGEFTLKSGRVSPYFFNAGLLNDGEALALLASGYADQLMHCEGVEVIFGPAYKGIPFVAATAVALAQNHQKSVPWGFNRKEAHQKALDFLQAGIASPFCHCFRSCCSSHG